MQTRLLPLVILLTASFAGTAVAAQKCRDDIPADTHPSQFVVGTDADGTPIVTDNTTGLVWQRCAIGYTGPHCTQSSQQTGYGWIKALDAVKAHPGWRVPNIKELYSLLELSCDGLALNQTIFPNAPRSYTTSSTTAGSNMHVWYLDFNNGGTHFTQKSGGGGLRLVRDAK